MRVCVVCPWSVVGCGITGEGQTFSFRSFAQNIARGILWGRYRNSLLRPELMEAGVVCEIRVDLGPVAARLEAGHRLRVDISGADFPLYDRNPNTAAGIFGSETVVATEAVHHAPEALSRIVLPVR